MPTSTVLLKPTQTKGVIMTPVWIVSFGYGPKFSFGSLYDATQFVNTIAANAKMVDSVHLDGEIYYKEDNNKISIMQGTFISKNEEDKLKDASDI